MAEWLYEAGVGEARAALVEDGEIIEARIEREGEGPRLGAVVGAKLVEAGRGGKGALVALDWPGEPQAILAGLPPSISTGAKLTVEITRMALRERGRNKSARARMVPPGRTSSTVPTSVRVLALASTLSSISGPPMAIRSKRRGGPN